MEHQAGKVEAVEGLVPSFRSKNKDNKHRNTNNSLCVGRWEQGSFTFRLVTQWACELN